MASIHRFAIVVCKTLATPYRPRGGASPMNQHIRIEDQDSKGTFSTAFWQVCEDSAKRFAQAAIAQLAARRSHNPKVGNSILSCRSWPEFIYVRLLSARHWRFYSAPGGASPRSQHIRITNQRSRGTFCSVSAGAHMHITKSNLAQDKQTQPHKVLAQQHAHEKPHSELFGQPRAPRSKSQEPGAKSQEPRAKSQELRAKSQEPRKPRRKRKRTCTHRGMFAHNREIHPKRITQRETHRHDHTRWPHAVLNRGPYGY